MSHAPSRVLRPSHSDHGKRFVFGSGNAAGVRRDDPLDALRVPRGERHADHAAPVVQDEREVLAQVQVVEQRFEVVDRATSASSRRAIRGGLSERPQPM